MKRQRTEITNQYSLRTIPLTHQVLFVGSLVFVNLSAHQNCQKTKKYERSPKKKINYFRNVISKFHNTESTHPTLTKMLQNLHVSSSLLCSRTMSYINSWKKRLKDEVENVIIKT